MSNPNPASGNVPPRTPPPPTTSGSVPVPAGWPPGYPPPQSWPQGYAPQGAALPPGWPPGYPPPQSWPQGYAPQGAALPPGWPPGYPPPGSGSVPIPLGMPPPQSGVSGAVPVTQAKAQPAGVPGRSISSRHEVVAAVHPDDELLAEAHVFHPPALTHIDDVKPPHPFVKLWRRVGGGSLTLSLAIHAGILVVAGIVVVSSQIIEKEVDFLPGGGTAQGAAASAEMKHQVSQKKRTSLNKSVPMKKIVSNNTDAEVTLPEAPPDLLDVPDVTSMMGGGSLGSGGFGQMGGGGPAGLGMNMNAAAGFVSLPPSMRSRCSSAERLQKLVQNGGSSECERAVSQSLEFLKGKQNPDGSWGRANKAAYTGMVLLCYLGRCETPESPFYGENVMKGIMYLVELGQKHPSGILSENPTSNAATYEHGIATYALGEMYTLARLGAKQLPGMRETFEKGVKLIIDNQNPRGSWTYGGDKLGLPIAYTKDSKGEDLSVAGWQFQALKAAKNSSLKIDGLSRAIDNCVEYILSKQTKDGGFGKDKRDEHYNQWSLTGCGVLGLQTLSKGKTASIKKGIGFLREFLTAEPLDWNKNCNLYCWYYYTQAFFQQGGEDWKFYNEQFLPQILAAQQPDGSFKRGRANWPSGDAADEIYRQALCTLQLEVYYRYLKVADRDEESFFDK
jgi:hypothetical protein